MHLYGDKELNIWTNKQISILYVGPTYVLIR
jgi:hypothetical protein